MEPRDQNQDKDSKDQNQGPESRQKQGQKGKITLNYIIYSLY